MIIEKKELRPMMRQLHEHLSYGTDSVFYPDRGVVRKSDLDFAQGSFDRQLFYHHHPYDSDWYTMGNVRYLYETLLMLDKNRVAMQDYISINPATLETTVNVGKLLGERVLAADLQIRMKTADWYYDYSDDPSVWLNGGKKIQDIIKDLGHLHQTQYGLDTAQTLWKQYVPPHSVTPPSFLHHSNYSTMNEKNLEYLQKQLKNTGYGEEHNKELREELKKQNPSFTLYHQQDYGKDNTVSALHFKKSENSDMYFFNKHTVILKNEKHPDAIRQTFYVDAGKDNVTLKEGYNLLSGRAVEKNLENKDGQQYKAWVQLNFKETDKHGNYQVKQFHEKYGFDLEKALLNVPLKLANPDEKKRLMESLQRGNRQSATIEVGGQERKIYIEAAPQFKSLNFYNEQGKRMQLQSILQNPAQAFGEKPTAKETKKQKEKPDDDLDQPRKKQTRRQGAHQ